jgi:hypothetical protein
LTHGLGDAHTLAVDIEFHEELGGGSEAGFGCNRRMTCCWGRRSTLMAPLELLAEA